jgi:hypothetical protein
MSIPLTTLQELELLEYDENPFIYDEKHAIILPNLQLAAESDSTHLTTEIFLRYFDQIILNAFNSNTNTVCYFKSSFISDYFITINFTNLKYEIPNALLTTLRNCKSTRFYIIPIALMFDYTNVGHANVVIIDSQFGTIEFFEPHGAQFSGDNIPYNIENHIKNLIHILFPANQGYTYKNVQSHCPMGLQTKQEIVNPDAGHCLAWSLLFIHVRLLNLIRSTDDIMLYFHNNFLPGDLNTYIKRYVGFLEAFSQISTVVLPQELKQIPYLKYKLHLSNTETKNIEDTIKQLINNYILEINSTKPDNNKITNIFEQLIAYHRYPNFNTLFMTIFSNIKHTNKTKHKRQRIS